MTKAADEVLTIASDLIKLNTTTGTVGETSALHAVAALFSELPGYSLWWSANQDALIVGPTDVTDPVLLLSGHVDTVIFETDEWSFDPLSGQIVDGWLLGRGASDMKSGVAAQVAAMLEVGPVAPVALALSTREEWGCAGTPEVLEALQSSGLKVGAILVAEPTDGKILLGHKGPLWLEVTVKGVSAHGSAPHLGVNAISKAARLLLRAEEELPRREHWRLGKETLNVGMINGGTMRNVVPDTAQIDIDIRTVDPDPTPLIDWFEQQPETASARVVAKHPPVWTSADNDWVRQLPGPLDATPASYGTEAAPLGAALNWPPTVIWGPGPRDQMHVIDEKAPVQAIIEAAEGYVQAIKLWQLGLPTEDKPN